VNSKVLQSACYQDLPLVRGFEAVVGKLLSFFKYANSTDKRVTPEDDARRGRKNNNTIVSAIVMKPTPSMNNNSQINAHDESVVAMEVEKGLAEELEFDEGAGGIFYRL
jgi:hypothetical protein